MTYRSIVAPKTDKIAVSHSHALGVANYDLEELYSPDTAFWKSKVLDLGSPKYNPNKTYWFDRSRYRNHGTISGATWAQLPSGIWGLKFDGNDYITIPDAPSLRLTTGSLGVLFRPNVITGGKDIRALIGKTIRNQAGHWSFGYSSTVGTLEVSAGTTQATSTGAITMNGSAWCLAFVVLDGTNANFYINDRLDSSKAFAGFASNTNTLYIGDDTQSRWIDATAARVWMTSMVLNLAQIQSIYRDVIRMCK